MRQLTHRQRQILEYINQHIDRCGYPPTVREIGDAVNLSSSSTVHVHLRNLEKLGLIKRDASLTRAIKLSDVDALPIVQKRTQNLPVLGRVAAGYPIPAIEDIEDTYPIPYDMLNGTEGFLLRVKGDSMIEDGIYDGDLVVVRVQPDAVNGDTVVAIVENEATVKRFYRENNRIRLQPANSNMQPMYYDSVYIAGKVVGLIRKMN